MPNPDIGYFQRASAEAVPEADARSANARILFTTCDARGALAQARQALAEDPSAVEAHLVIAELALETGNLNLAAKMLAKARALDPAEPRVHLLALPSSVAAARGGLAGRLLAMGWRVFDIRDFHQAAVFARMAREADASLAEAAFLHGLASLEIAAADRNEPVAAWRAQGAGLRSLRAAVALAPERGDFALELALHLRIAGLLSEAVATYRAALQRDPADALAGFALGEALLALESPDEAASALEAASARAPGNARLQHWLGHARKRQGRLPEAFTLHRQASGGCEAIRPRAGRRRVVFAVQHGPSWPCLATVHAAFAADPAWEAVVVALPYLHPSFTKTTDRRNEIFEFLGRKGIVYVRWDRFVLEADGADVIFLQNPDDSTRPPGWCTGDLLKTGARLAYVPDAIEFGGTVEDATHQFNLPLQQVAWAVFARSEAHRQMFARHCVAGDAHVAATGHPKFDPPLETETADPELVTWAAGRPIVLWSPHFDVRFDGTRFGDGYSTFLRWWDFLGEEFARRPHQAFVIRPHPLFFSTLEDRGILTAEQVATFRTGCAQTENVRLDQRGAYLPVLAAASALLSDASSLVFEFGCTGKPVCLLHNPHGPLTRLYYELDLDWVREHCAWATTEAEIRGFLDGVAAGAMGDPARRAADGRRRMGVRLDGIGAAIKRTVDERLAAEIQALPACPPSAQRIAV